MSHNYEFRDEVESGVLDEVMTGVLHLPLPSYLPMLSYAELSQQEPPAPPTRPGPLSTHLAHVTAGTAQGQGLSAPHTRTHRPLTSPTSPPAQRPPQ